MTEKAPSQKTPNSKCIWDNKDDVRLLYCTSGLVPDLAREGYKKKENMNLPDFF